MCVCYFINVQTHEPSKPERRGSAQSLCPSVDSKQCMHFRSPIGVDPHVLCTSCRGHDCNPNSTCSSWSTMQWVKFTNRRQYKKAASKVSSSGCMPLTTPLVADPSSSLLPPAKLPSMAVSPLGVISPLSCHLHLFCQVKTARRDWQSEPQLGGLHELQGGSFFLWARGGYLS